MSDHPQDDPGGGSGNGVKRKVKKLVKRYFVSSLTKKEGTYSCEHCPDQQPFENFKSLQRHNIQNHPEDDKASAEDLEGRDEIKCLMKSTKNPSKLCEKMVRKVDICRHLKFHGETRPVKKNFKGFFTFDKKNYTVAWGDRKENIEEETMVEVEEETDEQAAAVNTKEMEDEGARDNNEGLEADSHQAAAVHKEDKGVVDNNEGLETDGQQDAAVHMEDEDSEAARDNNEGADIHQAPEEFENNNEQQVVVNIVTTYNEEEILSMIEPDSEVHETVEVLVTDEMPTSVVSKELLANAELVSEIDLPVGATEEVSPSPPFHGYTEEEIQVSTLRKSPVVNDVLLSSSSTSSDSCPEFDIVEQVELNVPDDAFVSSLEYPGLKEEYCEDLYPQVNMRLDDLKAERYHERNSLGAIKKLSSSVENQKFIQMFSDWMESQSGENSTLSLKLGHNFHYPDSFLNWMTSQKEDFNLMRLIDFSEESNFISIQSPIKWLEAIGGPSGLEFPGRRDEAAKAFKKLLSFIRYKLNQATFDGESIMRKRAIKEHIKDVQEETNEMNLHRQYQDIASEQRAKRDEMSEILNPSNEEEKFSAPETWFSSEECSNVLQEAETIYKECIDKDLVIKKPFDRYAKIAFLDLAMSDKLRVGVYNALTNRDWATMKSVYLPAGYEDPDYDNLPKGWKIYSKPKLGNATPSRYEIRIPGTRKGLKNKQRQVITLNLRTHEMLERYYEMKRKKWPNLNFDDKFFVNFSGEALPPLRNYEGSLLHLVGRVTGIPGFTLKDTRKSLDSQIQNNPQLKMHIRDLNSHTAEVGAHYYDRLDGARRSLLNHCVNQKEGSDLKRASTEPSEEIKEKRSKQNQEDKEVLRKEAEDYLQQQKKKKTPKDLSPSSLDQEEIGYLCSTFKDVVEGKTSYFNHKVTLLTLLFNFRCELENLLLLQSRFGRGLRAQT